MIHKTILIGRLGRDPEMRYTASGAAVTNISVAVGENWTDQQGVKQEKTIWYRVACWRKLAESVGKWCVKGQLVMVKGRMDIPKPYQGSDGEWRCSLKLTAYTVKFLSQGRSRDAAGGNGGQQQAQGPAVEEEEIPF